MLHVERCFPKAREGNGRQAEQEEAIGNGENDNCVISVAPKTGDGSKQRKDIKGIIWATKTHFPLIVIWIRNSGEIKKEFKS